MTKISAAITGTGIICKGNVEGNFEQVPMELFDYIQLGLITHTDLVVYMKLLQFYNPDYGYAFPTIDQLMIYTNIKGKTTVHTSIKRLGEVGLIQKSKGSWGNNVYVVYKPLSKEELYNAVPDRVEQVREFESKLMKISVHDKARLQQHLQNKQMTEQQAQQIQARQYIPLV